MTVKDTTVRPVIGTQVNVTNMINTKKTLVTGGITAGVTFGNLKKDGVAGNVTATAGLNNTSIDLNYESLISDNWGVVGSTGVSYVQGEQKVTYPAGDIYLNSSLQGIYDREFFYNEAEKHLAAGNNAAYDELDMEVLIDGKKYATSGDSQRPAQLKIDIPEGSKKFLNKQFNWNIKTGAVYVNDKGNFEVQLGARMDLIKNWAPKFERKIECTAKESYKIHVGNVSGSEENFTTAFEAKGHSDLKITQQIQSNDKSQIRVSPYAALRYNVAKGLNLTAEGSLMGLTAGINYTF